MIKPKFFMQRIQTQWNALPAPRQRLVALGGGAVCTIILWLLIISPWISLQGRLNNAIPRLQGDLAKVRLIAGQISALPATNQPLIDKKQLRSDLLREFAPSGAPLMPEALREDEQQRLHLSIQQADFDATLTHLAAIQRKYPLKISSAKFTRNNNSANQIQANIVFELPPTP